MSEEKNVYIYNKHKAPIIVHARDKDGKILTTVTFQPERADSLTGRVVSTGYTPLTETLYGELCKTSKTFKHYKDDLKLLTAQDVLPPEAKTPHEALADARRGEREALAKAAALEAKIAALKAKLFDAETRYKTLESASTGDEKLKPLSDRIAALAARHGDITVLVAGFISGLEKAEIKDKAVREALETFKKAFAELAKKEG